MGSVEKRIRQMVVQNKRSGEKSVQGVERWYARYRTPDGKQRVKVFERERLAREFLTSVESTKLTGSFIDPARARVHVGTLAAEWLSVQTNLAPTTRERYEGIISRHITPAWGKVPLSAVTHAEVQRWVSELDLAPASVRKTHRVLSMVFDAAVRDQRLVRNPALKISLPRVHAAEKRFLTHEQVDQLAELCGPEYRTLVLFLAYTGVRWGEMAALRVHRLDLLRRRALIAESVTPVKGVMTWGPTKGHERREVPIPAFLVRELAGLQVSSVARLQPWASQQTPLVDVIAAPLAQRPWGPDIEVSEPWDTMPEAGINDGEQSGELKLGPGGPRTIPLTTSHFSTEISRNIIDLMPDTLTEFDSAIRTIVTVGLERRMVASLAAGAPSAATFAEAEAAVGAGMWSADVILCAGSQAPAVRRSYAAELPNPGNWPIILGRHVEGRSKDSLVFVGSRGAVMRSSTFRRAALTAAAETMGLCEPKLDDLGDPIVTKDGKGNVNQVLTRHLHPHELRHTAASLAIASGADVKVVQQMLGHKSATMTLDQYGHLFGDRLDIVADALDSARSKALKAPVPRMVIA